MYDCIIHIIMSVCEIKYSNNNIHVSLLNGDIFVKNIHGNSFFFNSQNEHGYPRFLLLTLPGWMFVLFGVAITRAWMPDVCQIIKKETPTQTNNLLCTHLSFMKSHSTLLVSFLAPEIGYKPVTFDHNHSCLYPLQISLSSCCLQKQKTSLWYWRTIVSLLSVYSMTCRG